MGTHAFQVRSCHEVSSVTFTEDQWLSLEQSVTYAACSQQWFCVVPNLLGAKTRKKKGLRSTQTYCAEMLQVKVKRNRIKDTAKTSKQFYYITALPMASVYLTRLWKNPKK